MKTIKVSLQKNSYNIVIGYDIINLLGKYVRKLNIGCDAYILTNAVIKNKYGRLLAKALTRHGISAKFKLIPDSEKSKSLETASSLINDLARYDKKRRIFIIAFGGGVIGDLAGFVSSIYKRGIPYIQIPTTLLAQVDSSIGGKTAVDLAQGKNLVGTFYQPRLVFSDVRFLFSLDLTQTKSGLAEIIKYALIKDKALFKYLEKNYRDALALKYPALEFIVKRCADIKAGIIQQDEKEEKGIRTILNFGHTIGHAIEAAGNYRVYNHGQAVALGMIAASHISSRLGLISGELTQRIEILIKTIGLPVKINELALSDIIKAHYRDKKFTGKANKFILLKSIGRTKIVTNVPLGIIKEALKKRLLSCRL